MIEFGRRAAHGEVGPVGTLLAELVNDASKMLVGKTMRSRVVHEIPGTRSLVV